MLAPGLYVERSPLSAAHLSQGVNPPHAYKPRDVVLAQLAGTTYLLADSVNVTETFLDLFTFGDAEVRLLLFVLGRIECGLLRSMIPAFVSLFVLCVAVQNRLNGSPSCLEWRRLETQETLC